LSDLVQKYTKRYGHQAAASGNFHTPKGVVPTGILALDYALGVGGWPKGHISTVYGPRDIGKSSVVGLSAIKSVQANGQMAAVIAVEPGFDELWAEKHGVDLDKLLVLWPDDGQEAFDMLYDTVMEDDIGLTLFDSIGKVQRPSEASEGGKASQGGASALISWGVSRILTPVWKRQKTVLMLNQVRDDMGARFPLLRQPGGHALEHCSTVIVQLKPGKDKYTVKEDGEDVLAGRELVAVVNRNKTDEGTGKAGQIRLLPNGD
jgi:recombination protein RecA